ncbi:uncharacterized protein N7473_011120 [Penicillium subrubescens]|uniref:uncharacterized protein n=1 Tax=Penicillium subrubescens TaxID=1316194 RepID=UPI002544F3D2|nr:uncharacterized protein N7473_011120 [Penicillium subrubescens]KAJ5882686.1 hypothetical protein N7473_011120 [Penicillium subrubescens]
MPIVKHLRRSIHLIQLSHARNVQETVLTWGRYVEDPQLVLPTSVQRPIEGLAVYTDGLLCTVTTDCGYVCRTRESIRKHWRYEHGWSVGVGGRVPERELPTVQQALQEAMGRVVCQRFFNVAAGSHYIHVRQPPSPYTPEEPPTPIDVTTRIARQLDQLQLDSQSNGRTTIQAGEVDEANSWLRRALWAECLQDIEPGKLLDTIAAPAGDADGIEAVAFTIWIAMGEVAQISQEITKATGNAIRSDAARIEKGQSVGKPLQAYMDPASIQKHVEPWRQILMFFVRTQAPHDWVSPTYQFTRRQRRAWEQFWSVAQLETDARRGRNRDADDEDPPDDPWTLIRGH